MEEQSIEAIILLVVVAVVALAVGVLLVSLAARILVPLIVGGAAALAVMHVAGWGRVEVRSEDGGYTLVVRVDRPLETLLVWLVLAVATAALLH